MSNHSAINSNGTFNDDGHSDLLVSGPFARLTLKIQELGPATPAPEATLKGRVASILGIANHTKNGIYYNLKLLLGKLSFFR